MLGVFSERASEPHGEGFVCETFVNRYISTNEGSL